LTFGDARDRGGQAARRREGFDRRAGRQPERGELRGQPIGELLGQRRQPARGQLFAPDLQ